MLRYLMALTLVLLAGAAHALKLPADAQHVVVRCEYPFGGLAQGGGPCQWIQVSVDGVVKQIYGWPTGWIIPPTATVAPFPWLIPDGKTLCITDMMMVNKFPIDPLHYWGPAYFVNTGAAYFGGAWLPTIPAHMGERHFTLPFPFYDGAHPTAPQLSVAVNNGQTETQDMGGTLIGYLTSTPGCIAP